MKKGASRQRNVGWAGIAIKVILSMATVACLLAVMVFAFSSFTATSAVDRLASLSNSDFGNDFDTFISGIQKANPQYEVIAVFDQDGNKLIEYTDFNESSVGLPVEAVQLLRDFEHLTHVHNHPVGEGIPDCPHSENDFVMPSRAGLADQIDTLVVACQNYTYYVDRGDNKWPAFDEMVDFYNELCAQYPSFNDCGFLGDVIRNGVVIHQYTTPKYVSVITDHFGYDFRIVSA